MSGAARRVKVALIGAGGWGLQHAQIFAGRPDVDLRAIVGRTAARTQARAAQFGTRAYLDIAQMLEREKPDLVSVCLPNQEHFAATLQVIEAGCPLLVEKPLVFALPEAETLLAEAARRQLFFAINFNHRFARPVQLARQALGAGELGRVVFAAWRFGGEGSSDHPHANVIETQCHGFDLLEYLCGSIATVTAQMTDMTGGGYRTVALALGFASGAVGTLLGTYDSSYAYPGTHVLEVNGTAGRVVIEDTVQRYTFQRQGDETRHVWQAGYFNDSGRAFRETFDAHVDALLAAFVAGEPPPVPATAGRRALVLARAAIDAFERGQRVTVEDAASA